MINGELPFKTWFRCTVCNDVHYWEKRGYSNEGDLDKDFLE